MECETEGYAAVDVFRQRDVSMSARSRGVGKKRKGKERGKKAKGLVMTSTG